MNINFPNVAQQQCVKLVMETVYTFMCATGYKPKTIYASLLFFQPFPFITELKIYNCRILQDPNLKGFTCYAFKAQLVD